MKLTADKLNAQISRKLAPVYFVSGDDPLVSGEVADAIRAAARKQGYHERESYSASAKFDWTQL